MPETPDATALHSPGLEVREFAIRSSDPETRTLTGVAVPFDTETRINTFLGHYYESIAPGACKVRDGEPKLAYNHPVLGGSVIGKVISHRDTDEGWEITARISETATGDEAYTLARDGVIDRFSIGFTPVEHTTRDDDDGIEHITRTEIQVREVSLVPFPAYDGAKVSAVRHDNPEHHPTRKENTMPETNTAVAELSATVEDLTRSVQLLQSTGPAGPAVHTDRYRSIGHLLKCIAAGDEDAIRAYEAAFEVRDFDGAVSTDTILQDAWVGNLVEIIKRRRPVLSTFQTGALPATGMTVEYAELQADTTQVQVQEDEGDDLAHGKVAIRTRNADVQTIGGWSSLSLQALQRASVGVLDTTWEALAEKYGQRSEARARAVLNAAINATGGGPNGALATVTGDLTTQDGVVAAVLDLAEHFEDAGRALDGVYVDKASFLALYEVEAEDRILQVTGAPADKVGTITVQTASGNVADLPFKLLPGAAADTVLAYDQTAIRTLEAPGAPFRLQDGNIVNLTQSFSLYGYLASFVQKRAGLVKVTPPSGGGGGGGGGGN